MDTTAPTGTVTFLFTDIEGSTPLWDAHPEAMAAALARHDELLRRVIEGHGGHVFATAGDGYGAAFARARDAVEAALEGQRRLTDEPWPEPVTLRVRMGLHTGEAEERDGDYFGPPVNQAARLMGAANGGQVVASSLTAGLLDAGDDVELVDLGPTRLKGIVDPVPVVGVAGTGHPWLDVPLVSEQASAGNLPHPTTDFVGDLADLGARVSQLARNRLVTLTGSGGVGKTRAAVEVGWLVVDEFVDGAWVVELAPVADADAVAAAVAAVLGVVPQAGISVRDSIVDWCVGRRMLLILDNCEHVLGAASELVTAINDGCSTVTVLATSREPLGLPGEVVVRIPSLTAAHAYELFVARARAADASFTPGPSDDEAIHAICSRLDGIPLAVELAAARTSALSPPDLLDRLRDRFRLLRSGGRSGLERHQTLRAAVTWSYELLAPDERVLFDRLSVFAGSFDLRAAEAVAGDGTIDELDVADLLGGLVDRSMVNVERADHGVRYRLLETLRQYGEERLDDDGTRQCRDDHLRHYVASVHDLHRRWASPEQSAADAAIALEWENIRAAHQWALASDDLDRAIAITRGLSGHAWAHVRREFGDWAARTLDLAVALGRHPASVCNDAAYWSYFDGDLDTAIERGRRGLEDTADPAGVARCRANLVFAFLSAGRHDEMLGLVPDLRADTERADIDAESRWLAAFAWAQTDMSAPDMPEALARLTEATGVLGGPTYRADLVRVSGMHRVLDPTGPDVEGGLALLEEAIELSRSAGARTSWPVTNRAQVMVLVGHPDRVGAVRTAIDVAYDSRNWPATALLLEGAARLLLEAGEHEVAATLVGHLELNPPAFGELGRAFREGTVDLLPDDERITELRRSGAEADRHQLVAAVADALARVDRSPTPS